ncbi:MAG TPA: YbdK family carboxylate-amine ligase [Gemmataceae bacterium]|nr:YbdK family carboxylate-amine ligase [Gemmataceae bacterium]
MSAAALIPSQQEPAHGPLEDLEFHPSAENSVGVELELQILDRDTGDLSSGAVRLLAACAEEGLEGVSAEFMQSQLEIKTGICHNVAALRTALIPLLRRVRFIANSLGYDLGLGGTHPFNRAANSAVFPAERYQRIQDQMAWLTHQGLVFGLHVHVGVAGGDMAIGVMNTLVQYLPHLLALSASSPFWGGIDTGLASVRSALSRMIPHGGLPHYFANWKDFCTYCRVMHDCRAIQATKDIHWDIRPRPQLGTVEFRICDMPLTLGRVFGLTALLRTLTIASQRLLEQRPKMRQGDRRHYWIAVENKWLATRYGLDAKCIRTPGGKRRGLTEDVARLLEQMRPTAAETGDADFLASLQSQEKLETGSDRLRGLYRETGDWRALIEEMKTPWVRELEEGKRS